MARGDGRSPSRAGNRRDDYRDSPRNKRGRSRSPERREREREYQRDYYRRRSRSPGDRHDRRGEDYRRLDRRDRSRERAPNGYDGDRRRRSRERGDRQDRYRDPHSRRSEDAFDANRSRRGGAADSKGPIASAPQSEEQIKAERQAKAAAWKKQKEQEAKGGTVSILRGSESKVNASMSPRSPSQTPTGASQVGTPSAKTPEPKPYTGKFDPKEIAKRASATSSASKTLDGDLNLPTGALSSRGSVPSKTQTLGLNNSRDVQPSTKGLSQAPLKAKGFELGGKQNHTTKTSAPNKPTMDFDDEESTKKTFQRLPTPPPMEQDEDVAMSEGQNPEQANEDAGLGGSDDEEQTMTAARAIAEKRREQMMRNATEVATPAEQTDHATEDVDMPEAVPEVNEPDDPLDAYMLELNGKLPTQDTSDDVMLNLNSGGRDAIFNEDDHEWDQAEDDNPLETRKLKKKKDLPIVDHSKIKYEPFRKSFFTPPSEITEMTEEEISNLRFELDGIKVHGKDVPRPVTKFAQCGLGVQSLDVVQKLGFDKPTSIQAQAIPAIMSGRDIIGVAKTGSGKTVAFLLPMFRHIKDQKKLEPLDGPIGLILAPTRELATQINRECRPWLNALNLQSACIYGGAPIKDQIAELKRGAEIVVCTPGRMVEMLIANQGRVTNLRRVTYVVLDEADRMFDMGFEPQIKRIIANVRPDKQIVLFSATFPKAMESLARSALKNPCEVIVGGKSVVAPEIEQIVEVRPENTKFARLLKLLGDIHEDDDARSLIFVATQKVAEDLASDIMKKGYPCNTIHGGKDQYDRDTTISDFKAGVFPVLVATSVAARGLDVKQLKLVVNFDCPNHLEDYVHRSGRTGRAGNKGTAVTFITPDQDKYAPLLQKALRQSELPIPDELQKLVDSFLEKVNAGTAKHMGSASGFKGTKGLEKLEKEREVARSRQRKAFNTGDDEEVEQEEQTKEETKEEEVETKPAGTSATTVLSGVPAGIDLDNIKVFKSEGAAASGSKDSMKGVSDAAAAISARLRKSGDIRGSAPIDNKGPDAGAFHSHIEINDFPQKARWAVTNRSNVSKILETTGTSITNKGNYYPPGQTPGPNDAPKLAILVEGDTELAVSSAMNQITRLLKEGCAAAADSEARAPTGGRYTVV